MSGGEAKRRVLKVENEDVYLVSGGNSNFPSDAAMWDFYLANASSVAWEHYTETRFQVTTKGR